MLSRRDFIKLSGVGLVATACDPREYARTHGATLRLSVAAGNVGGVYYPYGGAVAALISKHVPNVAATAEVTGGAIDNMQFIRQGTADLAFSTADMLSEAYSGTGAFAKIGSVPVRTIAVLYYNYIHIATLEGNGVRTIADLRGKVVSTGSAGSATEIAALRILKAAGLDPDRDVRRQGLGVGPAADALRDGKVDALVWSGGQPTAAILELATTPGRKLILLSSAEALPALHRDYGDAIYVERPIRAGVYRGVDKDIGVVSMGNMLAADAHMNDDLAYAITRAMFEFAAEIASVHAEGKHLTPQSAVQGSPIEFHPGAIRYYKERGVWTS